MFNFLVIQAGSPGSFLCAHVRITAAKRRFRFVHVALRKSFSPGLPSPTLVTGQEIRKPFPKCLLQRQSCHRPRNPGEVAGMLKAPGCRRVLVI